MRKTDVNIVKLHLKCEISSKMIRPLWILTESKFLMHRIRNFVFFYQNPAKTQNRNFQIKFQFLVSKNSTSKFSTKISVLGFFEKLVFERVIYTICFFPPNYSLFFLIFPNFIKILSKCYLKFSNFRKNSPILEKIKISFKFSLNYFKILSSRFSKNFSPGFHDIFPLIFYKIY